MSHGPSRNINLSKAVVAFFLIERPVHLFVLYPDLIVEYWHPSIMVLRGGVHLHLGELADCIGNLLQQLGRPDVS